MSRVVDAIHKMQGDGLKRPVTTLFMLMSVDGKISTGVTNDLDFDVDLPEIESTKKGLHQYYEIEKTTDEWFLCTGRTQNKIGINSVNFNCTTVDANAAIIDNNNLTFTGVHNLLKKYSKLVIFTENTDHPAFKIRDKKLFIRSTISLRVDWVLEQLCNVYDCERITIQSGSMTNGQLIKKHLIDYIDVVVAPIIVGGEKTPSLVGGYSFRGSLELKDVAQLELQNADTLEDSYLRLRYKVVNSK